MSEEGGKYDVGPNAPPKSGPPGPSGPAQIPTAPAKENTGHVRGGVRDGKLRNSGNSGAHRIGKKK